ncbi:MAG: energy-coupling factor transporter ATPase [Clostridiales bacterium]|jgi:energy-coupling factor transport system ATP-binding protein|nr:energy-coupling factor transporter ATPase [Clostridiales bacterium]
MKDIIVTENLRYSYISDEDKRELALDGISLSIEEGSFVAVLGHNGSGKSTFAKHLNAILLPEGGKVYVAGMDTHDENLTIEIRRQVGMVFQNPDNQMVANVVEEDVAFGPENLGVEPSEIRRRVDEALKLVGMYEYRTHAPHLLSGGQKQRIAIAGIIAMRPRCIVLDEPTAMLDPVGREEVIKTIRELNRNQGITVVLITHHMKETIDADRVIIMEDGRIVADGRPSEVFARVEEIKAVGLDVPDTTELIYELNREGFNLPLEALSVEECAEVIYAVLS